MEDPKEIADGEAIVATLIERFGPGFSNGVAAILLHEHKPEVFDKSCWAEWFFKPADAAFITAKKLGVIRGAGRGKWRMTEAGNEAARILLAHEALLTPTREDQSYD